MKRCWLAVVLLLGVTPVRADRARAGVQWPGWCIESWEESISRRYPLNNLADGRMQTAWVFNKAQLPGADGHHGPFRHGVRQSLQVRADAPHTIDGIALTNGYAKDSATYWRNNRIRKISVALFSGTSHRYAFTLRDTRELQRCSFPALTVSEVTITFEQVDAGRDDDLCISELVLLRHGTPVPWGLTPVVVTNDADMSCCCGGTVLQLRTRDGRDVPGPDGRTRVLVAAATQPGTRVMLLAAPDHLYLYDMARRRYRYHRAFPGELTLAPSFGWLTAHTAAVAVARNYGDWEHQVWYELRERHGRYHWYRTQRPSKEPPHFLPGARGPYYAV